MAETLPRAQLPNSEERILYSHVTRRNYRIDVLLPDTYSSTQKIYPVIYLLDGEFTTGLASSLTGFLHYTGHDAGGDCGLDSECCRTKRGFLVSTRDRIQSAGRAGCSS